MAFPLFLAAKYLKPKRSVASVITLVSILGVMLGVAVVIIVRSVMTGFGDIWEEKILDFKPHVSIQSARPGRPVVHGEDELAARLREIPGVTSVTPEIHAQILLMHDNLVRAPFLLGVESGEFAKAYKVKKVAGSLEFDRDSIVLGRNLADMLNVRVGDQVKVYSPKTLASDDEVYLPVKWTVKGIFSCGQNEYDSCYAIASLADLRDLMGFDQGGVSAIHLKTECPTDAVKFEKLVDACRSVIDETCRRRYPVQALKTVSWREADHEIFNALAVEKNMTALLLSLISLVAVFCVMNTLLVLTVQKTSEIGLLKALGFSRWEIMQVFVVHGMIQCGFGIALGLAASWAVLSNLQRIVEWLARMGLEVFPASVYGLAEIPHRLIVSDIFWVVGLVFAFGLLASFIPALIASCKDPVKALNQ